MLVFHAGAGGGGILRQHMQHRIGDRDLPAQPPDLLRGDGAGTQDLRGPVRQEGKHGGLHPDGAVVTFHYGIHQPPQVIDTMAVAGGTGTAAAVGAGGSQRHPRRPDHRTGNRMARHTDSDGIHAAGGGKRHPFGTGQHHRQRPRPEGLRQNFCIFRDGGSHLRQGGKVGDMDDHGVIAGAALGGIHRLYRRLVIGIGGQPVHRFGGNGDHAPVGKDIPCPQHALGVLGGVIYSDEFGFHHHSGCSLFCIFSACSCASSGSMSRSRSPFITASSRYSVSSMRWSLTRFWGKL